MNISGNLSAQAMYQVQKPTNHGINRTEPKTDETAIQSTKSPSSTHQLQKDTYVPSVQAIAYIQAMSEGDESQAVVDPTDPTNPTTYDPTAWLTNYKATGGVTTEDTGEVGSTEEAGATEETVVDATDPTSKDYDPTAWLSAYRTGVTTGSASLADSTGESSEAEETIVDKTDPTSADYDPKAWLADYRASKASA
ncbi:MAG: hypothetical protein R3Y12_04015 [Clostridia bacterium]